MKELSMDIICMLEIIYVIPYIKKLATNIVLEKKILFR